MKITKFGHCCLLIEQEEVCLITDPGAYSDTQNSVKNIDAILITHEHQDHFHLESLKAILKNSPNARVITNTSVAALLIPEGICGEIVEADQRTSIGKVSIEGVGNDHAILHSSISCIQNTGYLIGDRLFYPGDALTMPDKHVGILALPVAGPWLKLSDAIDYAIMVKPDVCFPVHEAMYKNPGLAHRLPPQILEPQGIKFAVLELGEQYEL